VADSLGLAAKVGLDSLLTGGILGGDIQELPHRARGLTAEHVDEGLAVHAKDEGVDHVSVGDVGKLMGIASPLPIVTKVP
jgi:hypothetical protein